MNIPAEQTRSIYCAGCGKDVQARLTYGTEIYPHRGDLAELPFWKCDTCGNYVGCHHKTDNPTRPLGIIPTKELKTARMQIHALLDPLWKEGTWGRRTLYARLTDVLGYQYHTANIRSVEEAERVIKAIKEITNG